MGLENESHGPAIRLPNGFPLPGEVGLEDETRGDDPSLAYPPFSPIGALFQISSPTGG